MFNGLGFIFAYLFFNGDEVLGMKLHNAAEEAYSELSGMLKFNIAKVADGDALHLNKEKPSGEDFLALYGEHMIQRMLKDKKNKTHEDIVTQVLLTASGLANLSAEVLSRIVKSNIVCATPGFVFIG